MKKKLKEKKNLESEQQKKAELELQRKSIKSEMSNPKKDNNIKTKKSKRKLSSEKEDKKEKDINTSNTSNKRIKSSSLPPLPKEEDKTKALAKQIFQASGGLKKMLQTPFAKKCLLVSNNVIEDITENPGVKKLARSNIKNELEELNAVVKLNKVPFNLKTSKYLKNKREIDELLSKIEIETKNAKEKAKKYQAEIQKENEELRELEAEFDCTNYGYHLSLKEANEEQDMEITKLNMKLEQVTEETEIDIKNKQELIEQEIDPLIEKLKKEISYINKIKKEVKRVQNQELPQNIKKKLEVIFNYKTSVI